MDVSVAKSVLDRFFTSKPNSVEGDDATTTLVSCGAVLLASAMARNGSARELSQITGFPMAFTAAVLAIADADEENLSLAYAGLIKAVDQHPEDIDKIEVEVNESMVAFWEGMDYALVGPLNMLRARYLVGGGQQTWLHDDTEFDPLDDWESSPIN